MTLEPRFTFVHLPKKVNSTLSDKEHQENILKWGFQNQLKVLYYNFNQEFKLHDKDDFISSFFRDPSVLGSLEVLNSANNWSPVGVAAEKVDVIPILTTEISMKFFDKMKDESNGVVRCGFLTECMCEYVDGMLLQDNLQHMLLTEEHFAYNLYSESEKQQFIFQLFRHICLGGAYCQRSQTFQPYLDFTKSLYKELISVDRMEKSNQLRVRSMVVKVVARSWDGLPLAPTNPEHPQNFIYLIIDPVKRQVAALCHQFGGYGSEFEK